MKLEKLSLKWQIVGWLLVVIIAILMVTALVNLIFVSDVYQNLRERANDELISEISSSISGKSFSENCVGSDFWRENLSTLCAESYNSIKIIKIGTDEVFFEDTMPTASALNNPVFCDALISKALRNGGRYVERADKINAGSMFIVETVSATDGEVAILVNTMVKPMNFYSNTFQVTFVINAVAILVISVILGIIITSKITKPIAKITSSSKDIVEGKFTYVDNSRGFKEIKELGDSLSAAAKEISKSELLQKELIANISHDLRTPLTIISGYAEFMRDFKDADHTDSIEGILNETKRMSDLVSDVLDLSQIEAGALYHDAPMSITECVNSTLSRFSSLKEQGYSFEFEHDGNVMIKADEKKIMQVIYNLVANAVNYGGADKLVLVRQEVSDGTVKISVTDHGEGIPETALRDVWQRYYKLDREHRRASKGSGLGLAIVKGILENYSSCYGVDSTLGKGSTFWFSFKVFTDQN